MDASFYNGLAPRSQRIRRPASGRERRVGIAHRTSPSSSVGAYPPSPTAVIPAGCLKDADDLADPYRGL